MTLRNRVVIAGVGESEIGKVPGMTGLALNAQAARRALDDAGLTPADVDGLVTAYSVSEPYFMYGTVLCEYLGLKPRLCASMTMGGATGGILLEHAAMAIATGQASTVLVCVGENRATGISRDQAVAALAAVGHPAFETPYGPLIPGFYAMIARRHMHEYGTTREQMAAVAVQARRHASLHPRAQMRKPITIADVLDSKPIADPLRLLDCCLISDAAGALVVTPADRAADLRNRPAWLYGVGEFHTHEHLIAAPSLTRFGAHESSGAAYRMAGVGPADIDFAELYDCFTIVPILEAEEVGFAKAGEGGALFGEGATTLEGRLPVNTHGGMLSHAHAGAAGGLLGIVEAVRQLRGDEGVRQVKRHDVALVHNEGGILSSHCTVILGRDRR
ncbi:MAG: thiolase family protein [Candidatus Rokubacteria bacterium]|nr:thiolase family protein [Candidatus Rokubacteria bacterium]